MSVWDKKQSKLFLSPTLGRKFILKKNLLQLMGPLQKKRVLEFGCGNGYWMRLFRDNGAVCVGVDLSAEQIKLARSFDTENITYLTDDAEKFTAKGKFDIVFIDHVLSETSSSKKAIRILCRARALLKKDGFIILSEVHPSVAHFPFGNVRKEKDYFYFKSAAPLLFRVKLSNDKYFQIQDYHWTLQDFSEFLKKAGLIINEIIEPKAPNTKFTDNYLRIRRYYPSHLIIKTVTK